MILHATGHVSKGSGVQSGKSYARSHRDIFPAA